MLDIVEEIKKDIKENKIMLYIKGTKDSPQCGFSAAVIDIFKFMGVPFETRNVLEKTELREEIKKYTSWNTIPQVFIDGKFVGGCDITRELYQNGELQKLVENAKQDS